MVGGDDVSRIKGLFTRETWLTGAGRRDIGNQRRRAATNVS